MGILQQLRQSFKTFFFNTPTVPQEDLNWELRSRGEEKLASAPNVSHFPLFLPYYEPQHSVFETQSHRLAYRRMLSDPNVKSALLNQILSVAAVDVHFIPYNKKNKRDNEIAEFISWNFKYRIKGGISGTVWNIFSGGLIDGFSINEKIFRYNDLGKFKQKVVISNLKPKDVNNDLVLHIDHYNNVTGIQGLRYNAGEIFPPKYFVHYAYLPLFNNPTGMSALRAAYSRYWMLDTVMKLRAMGAEKRALPVVIGEYPDITKQKRLETMLAQVKSRNWLAVPKDVKIHALDIAGQSDDYFKSFCADLREEIVQSIQGATLQAMAGRIGQIRGDTSIHKNTADVWKWFISAELMNVYNDWDNGLIRELVDMNYAGVDGYPLATFEGIDEAELERSLRIDRVLEQIGFHQSIEAYADRYGREPIKEGETALAPPVWNRPVNEKDQNLKPEADPDKGRSRPGTSSVEQKLAPVFQHAEGPTKPTSSETRTTYKTPSPTADDPLEDIGDLETPMHGLKMEQIENALGRNAQFNPDDWLPFEGLRGGKYWRNFNNNAVLHDYAYQRLAAKDRTRVMADIEPESNESEFLKNMNDFVDELRMVDKDYLLQLESKLAPIVQDNKDIQDGFMMLWNAYKGGKV